MFGFKWSTAAIDYRLLSFTFFSYRCVFRLREAFVQTHRFFFSLVIFFSAALGFLASLTLEPPFKGYALHLRVPFQSMQLRWFIIYIIDCVALSTKEFHSLHYVAALYKRGIQKHETLWGNIICELLYFIREKRENVIFVEGRNPALNVFQNSSEFAVSAYLSVLGRKPGFFFFARALFCRLRNSYESRQLIISHINAACFVG